MRPFVKILLSSLLLFQLLLLLIVSPSSLLQRIIIGCVFRRQSRRSLPNEPGVVDGSHFIIRLSRRKNENATVEVRFHRMRCGCVVFAARRPHPTATQRNAPQRTAPQCTASGVNGPLLTGCYERERVEQFRRVPVWTWSYLAVCSTHET